MQKSIREIKKEISAYNAKTAWDRGVKTYADEIFSFFTKARAYQTDAAKIGKITEQDLLGKAKSWEHFGQIYNYSDEGICKRLCNKRDRQRTHNGELPPSENKTWCEMQTEALTQAAKIVLEIVNRRDSE